MPANATAPRTSKGSKKKMPKRIPKMVYLFGPGKSEGKASMKQLLGGKGANLAEMTSIGLPVPPGFTITTETCEAYIKCGNRLPAGLMDQVDEGIRFVETVAGKRFGDRKNPLLVSVRSGAAISMPGMMDTILNLGLNDQAVVGLASATGNERFAYDAYRRLINMFGDVVMGVPHESFEKAFTKIKKKYKAKFDTDVPADGICELCEEYKKVYCKGTGHAFPQDPRKQLIAAVGAVFGSWNKHTAITYRKKEGITGLLGTAVNVQTMVFGNMGDDSGTGVAFTRNPSTGRNEFYGEFLVNAQGEDVVAGIRTPRPVSEMKKWSAPIHRQLLKVRSTLEKHYREMQDFEFTIERGSLYMLQTRNGKRTAISAAKIAVDMVKEKLIDQRAALLRFPAEDITQLLLPHFDAKAKRNTNALTTGLPASPGAAVGKLAFTAADAARRHEAGESVILVRRETSPEDVEGMHAAVGILTSTGGMTSHAAVVARGWGKCCVAGAGEVVIDAKAQKCSVNGRAFGPGDFLSIDGATGEVFAGRIDREDATITKDLKTVLGWADEFRRLGVRTNADTPEDAVRARAFGAEGIGLCRTEHMFFDPKRIEWMRRMILAETQNDRVKALKKLLPFQRDDFEGILTAMKGLPVTIRLLDPPLHEFLPQDRASQQSLATEMGVAAKQVAERVQTLHEANPMLGHRGCRLAVTYPEILEMQVRAITEASIRCKMRKVDARPEIMIPLVGTRKELALLRDLAIETIEQTCKDMDYRGKLDIPVGTMIEIPRAAITADEIADVADFFSFGTNDLTQLTFGYSRDDVNTFLPDYLESGILPCDPFQSIDTTGVGVLVEMACRKGRAVKPNLKLGICGEHGGDPASVVFCHGVGLDYVSCSPFRVPIARLAAAQAAAMETKAPKVKGKAKAEKNVRKKKRAKKTS